MTELPQWLRGMASVLFREAQSVTDKPEVFVVLRSLAVDCQAGALLIELQAQYDAELENEFAEADTVPGRNATRVGVAPLPGE